MRGIGVGVKPLNSPPLTISGPLRPDDGHEQAFHWRQGEQGNRRSNRTEICGELPVRHILAPKDKMPDGHGQMRGYRHSRPSGCEVCANITPALITVGTVFHGF